MHISLVDHKITPIYELIITLVTRLLYTFMGNFLMVLKECISCSLIVTLLATGIFYTFMDRLMNLKIALCSCLMPVKFTGITNTFMDSFLMYPVLLPYNRGIYCCQAQHQLHL